MNRNIKLWGKYTLEELPENQMSSSGNPEYVDDNVYAIIDEDGMMYEFRRAYQCTAIAEVTDDGDVELIDGKLA